MRAVLILLLFLLVVDGAQSASNCADLFFNRNDLLTAVPAPFADKDMGDFFVLMAQTSESPIGAFISSGAAYVLRNAEGLKQTVTWKMAFTILEFTGEPRTQIIVVSPTLNRETQSSHFIIDRAVKQWLGRAGLAEDRVRRLEYGYIRALPGDGKPAYLIDDLSSSGIYAGNIWHRSDRLSTGAQLVQRVFKEKLGVTVLFPPPESAGAQGPLN